MTGIRERLSEDTWRIVGAEVHRLRTQQGWSLAELSRKTHYSAGYLSKIENGKKRITPQMASAFDEVFATGGILTALLAAREEPTPADEEPELSDAGACPYPGLVAFGPAEACWFFGREQVVADLIARLDERLGGGGPLAVVAPSGTGKSSLLAAGLIPQLAGGALPGSGDWPVVGTTPGAHPLATVVERVVAVTEVDPAAAAAVRSDPDRFTAFLTQAAADGKPGETPSSVRVVLIIDQFEEIFTECRDNAERQVFIAALGTAAASPAALVILGVRADFYSQCLELPAVSDALKGHLPLAPMSPDQLREVIIRPAQVEGLELEPGLVELLLRDLGVAENGGSGTAGYDPGALPLLAHALRGTWLHRGGRTLTVAGYQRTGGIRQALSTTAERAYLRLDPTKQQVARQVLLRLVNVREHGSDTRRRLPRDRLEVEGSADAVEAVLEVFSRARLLTLDTTHVQIIHEALLTAWPRLTDWINTDRAGLRTHQQLAEAAHEWHTTRRDPSSLYRGSRLTDAHRWATDPRHKNELSSLEREFLDASIDQQQQEQQAERRRTRLRQSVALLTALVVIVAAGLAYVMHQRNRVFSVMVADRANQLGNTDPTRGMQLSAAAYGVADSTEARSSLLSASTLHSATSVFTNFGPITTVAISHDGDILAAGSNDQAIRIYDISDPSKPTQLSSITDHTDAINTLAFSPKGRLLASGSGDRTVRLWDLTDPATPRRAGPPLDTRIRHNHGVNAVAFSPDGQFLAIGGADGAVRLWDLNPDHFPEILPGQAAYVNVVAFNPTNGHMLVSGNDDGTLRVWDLTHPNNLLPPLRDPRNPTNNIFTLAFSPDGKALVTGGKKGTVSWWNGDLADPHTHTRPLPLPTARLTPANPNTVPDNTSDVTTAAFSPDGNSLVIGRATGTVQRWDLTKLHDINPSTVPNGILSLTGDAFSATNKSVNAVAFSGNRGILVSGSGDGVASLTDITDPRKPTLPVGMWAIGPFRADPFVIKSVETVAFSPNGHTIASGTAISTSSDADSQKTTGMVLLWDVNHPGSLLATLDGGGDVVNAVAFNPSDENILAGGSADGVRLWNLTQSQGPLPLATTSSVNAVTFSPPAQHLLASGNADGIVQLWDIAYPRQPINLPPFNGNNSWVTAVAFSPDGRMLASGGADGKVRLWSITTTHKIIPLPDNDKVLKVTTYTHSLAFSRSGQTLISGNNDGTLSLWDLTDPRHPSPATTVVGHDQMVRAVAFSHDGNMLATGSDDQTVKLWDFSEPHYLKVLAILKGHSSTVPGVEFSPDGNTLASGSEDASIRLWDTKPDNAREHICSSTPPIINDLWELQLPGMPKPSCP